MRTSVRRLVVAGSLAGALLVPAGIAVAASTGPSPTPPATGTGGWRAGGCPMGSAQATRMRELRREHWNDMRRLRGGDWSQMQRLHREHQRDMQRLWTGR